MSPQTDSLCLKQDKLALLEAPFTEDTLLQIRTGKVKPLYNLPVQSAIYKAPRNGPVKVSILGCDGDEQAFEFHGGPDKALLHYCVQHYDSWKEECPQSAHRFNVGGFGENLVSTLANERNVCIGDVIDIGDELRVQVSLPRAPCFKLNHRFEVKDMAKQSQDKSRTGWLYRVLRPGSIKAGDRIKLVERPNPKWTVHVVEHYLYRETKNSEAMSELVQVPELGEEVRTIFNNRLKKGVENQDGRLFGDESLAMNMWSDYKIVQKSKETPRIASFVLEAVEPVEPNPIVEPGSHVRLKLGKLMRSYSVVGGTHSKFELGMALDANSRGGSEYLHKTAQVGDIISASKIVSSFPLAPDADHHILIAGGIGITAFLATAAKMQKLGQSYVLHLAIRSSNDIPFKRYLDKLAPNVVIHDKSKGRTLSVDQVMLKANNNTHIYCCGPARLMDGVAKAAKEGGIPETNVHFEAFEAATGGDPFTAELVNSEKKIEVDSSKTLLEVLRDAGLDIPSSCEAGSCGTCRVNVQQGRVEHRGTGLLESDKKHSMLSCVSRGVGHIVLEI